MAKWAVTRDGALPESAELAGLVRARSRRPFPPAADREAWQAVAERPHVHAADLTARAEEAAAQGPPPLRATDYLSFFRTGRRDAHAGPARARNAALAALTAAECLEGRGRFLDPLLDLSWAICEETSWVMPPHLPFDGVHVLPDVESPVVDLRVAGVGRQLGEMLGAHGAAMDAVTPVWRRRVQHELRRQVVEPYLAGGIGWMTGASNWNAVCTAGAVAAALLGGFPVETQARALREALGSAQHFLRGFTEDGGSSEGPGYWAYGVGNYCALAYYVHCATGGEVDMLADPIVPRLLAYPAGMVLSGRKVANFADCPPEVSFRSGPVAWAAERAGVPPMVALAARGAGHAPRRGSVLDVWLAPEPGKFAPPAEAFLPELQVMVARTAGEEGEQLVLAAKGGHNGEIHNHNDVGAFIVHWRGESLICDLGAPEYVKDLFSARRYELLGTGSRDHDVPLVNGVEQGAGEEFRASGFARVESGASVGVAMELSGAYPPEAGLRSLRRRLVLRRGAPGRVELVDEVEFSGEGRRYELPLHSEARFEAAGEGAVAAGGFRIEWDPSVVEARLEEIEHEDRRLGERFGGAIPRCTLRLKGTPERATVRLLFTPRA